MHSWDDLLKFNYARHIARYFRLGCQAVVLAFDDYERVLMAKVDLSFQSCHSHTHTLSLCMHVCTCMRLYAQVMLSLSLSLSLSLACSLYACVHVHAQVMLSLSLSFSLFLSVCVRARVHVHACAILSLSHATESSLDVSQAITQANRVKKKAAYEFGEGHQLPLTLPDEMWKYAVYFADATSHSSFVIVSFSG